MIKFKTTVNVVNGGRGKHLSSDYIHPDLIYTGWAKNWTNFKCITPVYDDVGRLSIYQNVKLFMTSKTGILNVAMLSYRLHLKLVRFWPTLYTLNL